MPRDKLKNLLNKARQTEPVPDFQKVWGQAKAMELEKIKTPPPLRRVLVPIAAAAAIAVLMVVGVHVGTDKNGQNLAVEKVQNRLEMLAHLEDIAPWTGELDGLGTEWTFELTSVQSSDGDEVDTSVISVFDNIPGDDIYESPTDFLLDLEIPTWNRSEERNVL
ncbi:MAG: hypothetical protein GY762_22025 [Proteobacteria bacterium]|nr:hypothetical protein [Pseudomonadota bacterium]